MGFAGRLEVRGRGLRFGLAASAVVVAAGAAAVAVWPHAWPWLAAGTAVIAAVAPVTVPALTAAQQRRTDKARVARQVLQGTAGTALPLVKDTAELDARVHRAVLPIAYVRRDVEDGARQLLESGRPVLLVGSSMVGKTQMAVMLIRGMFAGRGIAIPDSIGALASLDAADVVLRGSVIFLDDINRLIGTGGISDGTLRRLAAAGNAIVGTIRAAEYDRYQPTDQLRPAEWDVLSVFERVFVSRELSEDEEDRLTEAVTDRDVRERISRAGLGEYVGAAVHIEEALRLGPSVNPVGYATVQGAADWQRAGMSTPVPASVLPALAAPHLAARHRAALADQPTYGNRAAVGDAGHQPHRCTSPAGRVRLLYCFRLRPRPSGGPRRTDTRCHMAGTDPERGTGRSGQHRLHRRGQLPPIRGRAAGVAQGRRLR